MGLCTLWFQFVPVENAAAVACDQSIPNFQEGWVRDNGASKRCRGITAEIETRTNAETCVSTHSFSMAWVAIQNGKSGSLFEGGIAQIGYLRNGDTGGCGCMRYFWEWGSKGSDHIRTIWGTPTEGKFVKYRVDWQPGDGLIHLFYDPELDGFYNVPPNNGGDGTPPVTFFNPDDDVGDGVYWDWVTPVLDEEFLYEPTDYQGTSGNTTFFLAMLMREYGSGNDWISLDLISAASSWSSAHYTTHGAKSKLSNYTAKIWDTLDT